MTTHSSLMPPATRLLPATRHPLARHVEGARLPTFRSNRHIPLLEFLPTHSKQRPLVLSNRHTSAHLSREGPPWRIASSPFTRHSPSVICCPISNRTRQRLEIAVTSSKQRPDMISNRTFLHALRIAAIRPGWTSRARHRRGSRGRAFLATGDSTVAFPSAPWRPWLPKPPSRRRRLIVSATIRNRPNPLWNHQKCEF